MTDAYTSGPLSKEELLDLWKTVVDELYAQPLLEEGEGFGLEVHTQGHAQFERVSKAIDVTTQALYIQAWSGQTSPPAGDEAHATVTLSVARTSLTTHPLLLKTGQFIVQEETTDAGDGAAVQVFTGRTYVLTQDLLIGVGDTAPHDVTAQATIVGVGFNNPLPGTIKTPFQPGTEFANDRASVILVGTGARLVVENQPDVVIPQHVGSYVVFTSGANAGQIRLMTGYHPPVPDGLSPNGGSVDLDNTVPLLAETFTASWRILDWAGDWGLTVTNTLSPVGGSLDALTALGEERRLPRAPGEPAEAYRERISQIADVVTPNAIIRAVNRVVAPYGAKACLREVGSLKFPGFYFDGDPFSTDPAEAFAWDMDKAARHGVDRWKTWLSFLEFRAFFLVGLPNISIGEFGFAYDAGSYGAYDAAPYNAFYDGYPVGTANLYRQIYQAVDKVHAGGVGFDFYVETGSCQ
jgi:hypothetical protein